MSNDLMIPEVKEPQKVFVEGGTKPFIKAIQEIVKEQELDVTTPAGRKQIASLAHSVARSKTYLDGIGKDLVSDIKAKAKIIDAERKLWRDTCDAIKAEVRAPLDEFEEAEKQRIAGLEDRIAYFDRLSFAEYTPEEISSADLKANLKEVKAIEADDSFEELKHEAIESKMKAVDRLELLIVSAEKREKEKAELEALRKEQQEKEAKEREERIRKEERERMEREQKEAELAAAAKAKAEKEAHEKAMKDAEERAKQAEIKAKEDAKRAAEAERQKIEAEKRAEEEAKRKREEDQKHRAKINNEALKALMAGGIDEETGKQVIRLIASREVPNVQINY